MRNSFRKLLVGVLPLGMLMGGLVPEAQANRAGEYRQQLEGWSQRVVALSEKDTGKTTGDIERLRSMLSQGQAYVASERLDRVSPLLERMDALEAFVQAKQARVSAEKQADEAESMLKATREQLAEIRAAAADAKKAMEKLEAKGL